MLYRREDRRVRVVAGDESRAVIANSNSSTPTVSNAWSRRVPSLNLDVCCLAALKDLSGRSDLRTRPEWEAWWKQTDKATAARGHVTLLEQ